MQFIPSYGVLGAALFDFDDDFGDDLGGPGRKRRKQRRKQRRAKRQSRRRIRRARLRQAVGIKPTKRQRQALRQRRRRRKAFRATETLATRGSKAAARKPQRMKQRKRLRQIKRRIRQARRQQARQQSPGFNRDALLLATRKDQKRLLLPPGSSGFQPSAASEGGYAEEGMPGAYEASGMPGFPGVSELPGAEIPANAPGANDATFATHYVAARQAMGLPPLPPDAGQTAPQIAQYLVNAPADDDKRETLSETAQHILAQAADAATQAGDTNAAARFQAAGEQWAQQEDLGFYGFYGDADDARQLPAGMTTRSVVAIAGGLGAAYAYSRGHRKRRKDDTQTIWEAAIIGGGAALGAHVLLRVLGYED